ncbi:MAG TPA: hypothetical protein VHN11_20850 [Xanthobacteraceae bacterium]|jgi:hypothetical protein|nr:hypothetical protein [Xanthobacteraceae bacterium]
MRIIAVERHSVMAGCQIIFACPGCGTTFHALQKRTFNVGAKSFSCLVCDKVMHRWHGVYDYVDWHLT